MDQGAPDGSAAAGVARQAGRQLEVERGAARCAAVRGLLIQSPLSCCAMAGSEEALPGVRPLDVIPPGHMCSDRHKIKRPAGERTCFQARCIQTDTTLRGLQGKACMLILLIQGTEIQGWWMSAQAWVSRG